jgi:hypothetical protein
MCQKDTLQERPREAHGPNSSTMIDLSTPSFVYATLSLYQAFLTVPTSGMTRDSGHGLAGIEFEV